MVILLKWLNITVPVCVTLNHKMFNGSIVWHHVFGESCKWAMVGVKLENISYIQRH